jgi:hypothetical protein
MTAQSENCLVGIQEGNQCWLVVRTKPRQELVSLLHLRQRDVRPYCPLFLEPPWHPRAPKGPVPLFAGYIFVQCHPRWHLNAVRFCPGVSRIVTFDQRLATVGKGFIEALRAREGDRGYILPVETELGIPVGSKVRIMSGPLRGLEGVFQGYLRGRERSKVLMQFLRGRKAVEVDTTSLAMVRC